MKKIRERDSNRRPAGSSTALVHHTSGPEVQLATAAVGNVPKTSAIDLAL